MRFVLVLLVCTAACGDSAAPRIPTVYRLNTSNIRYQAFDSRPDSYYRERWLGPSTFNTLTLSLDTPARGELQLIGQLEALLYGCDVRNSVTRPTPADCTTQEVPITIGSTLWFWYFRNVAAQGTYSWRGDTLHVDFPSDSTWLTSGGGFGAVWRRVGNDLVFTTSYDDLCGPPNCALVYEAKIALNATWTGQ